MRQKSNSTPVTSENRAKDFGQFVNQCLSVLQPLRLGREARIVEKRLDAEDLRHSRMPG